MKMVIQKFPRCLWHIDCPENAHNSGVVKDYPSDGDRTPVECLHCGEKATVMRGTEFDVPFTASPPAEGVEFKIPSVPDPHVWYEDGSKCVHCGQRYIFARPHCGPRDGDER